MLLCNVFLKSQGLENGQKWLGLRVEKLTGVVYNNFKESQGPKFDLYVKML